VYLLELPEPSFTGKAALKFPEKVKVTTGIQKLAQQYVITLFTAPGSDTVEPLIGTTIGEVLLGGIAPVEEEIRHFINIGNSEAEEQIATDQQDVLDAGLESIPEDEQLASATVLDVRIRDKTRVEFDVLLTTVAGDSRAYIVPLPIVV